MTDTPGKLKCYTAIKLKEYVVTALCLGLVGSLFSSNLFFSYSSPLLEGNMLCIMAMENNVFIFIFFIFLLFRAADAAYGSSQVRGQIRAVADSLHHSNSNTRSEPCLQPIPHSWQCQILDPLSEARDQTSIVMDTSQIGVPFAATRTPENHVFKCEKDT